jgi:undecaprenyl-phosphate 4-deoxy-4-formamido-L-arabinose transferase
MVEVSVVIPVYNSAGCLDELVRRIEEALSGLSHEIILVDDGSTDGSWRRIGRLAAARTTLVGIRLRRNAGQDAAILCGLRRAQGAFAVIMDDDLQHNPRDIPALRRACRERGLDVCYAQFTGRRHAWWKRAGSWLNGKVADIVIDKPRDLYLSPFKILRREVVAEIIQYGGAFPYVDGLILGVTSHVGQTAATHSERFQGRSHYGLAKSLLVFLRVATGFSVWPLRFATGVGAVCAASAFGLALFYVIQYVVTSRRVEGWLTLVAVQLLLGGLVLLALGMIGEYLGRLYLNSNGKPQSTIAEVVDRQAPPSAGAA